MNLDHERARHADRCAATQMDKETAAPGTSFKDYRSVALKSIAQVRQEGLLQLAAFWVSKGGEECVIFRDLMDWLGKSPRTSVVFPTGVREVDNANLAARAYELLSALTGRSSAEIALLEDEAELYLGWLKRLVEGRNKALKAQETARTADTAPQG